jgi:hypothetical protein
MSLLRKFDVTPTSSKLPELTICYLGVRLPYAHEAVPCLDSLLMGKIACEREDGESTCKMNEKHAKLEGRCRNLGGYENLHIHKRFVF